MTEPLTLVHREAQLQLARTAMLELLQAWPQFDVRDIDNSWPLLERLLMQLMRSKRTASVALAQTYYRLFREAQGIATVPPLITLGTEWEQAALVSINVTGPVLTKSAIAAARPLELVVQDAFVRVTGAATRHILNGGREALSQSVRKDRAGWQRVTSASPCRFCAMLRDRGAVYKEETAKFLSHDHCACTAEPVFRKGAH
jgi:hypothetical protein